MERAQKSCVGVLVVPDTESPYRGPNPCERAEPCRLGNDISHLVLFSPGRAKNGSKDDNGDDDDDGNGDEKADWTKLLRVNRQIKKLTFVQEDHPLNVSHM
ncbi:hypothetical protein RvY_18317 [Ramazzottius varieornatus]|uniref:Uncharacterized protein n=1 Tax=Ramazzottius varieornatus TaxID=947166 RepID=A0A1D1W5A6_RAMVA|nr:hypothetical protein RvY_18317 [Ramazzottius varieornatus]